jgi:hypothetical protein
MRCECWNEGWSFWPDKDAFALVWNVPDHARTVTLPHDAMIEAAARADSPNKGNTGYRDGGNYTYRKELILSERELGGRFLLRFDGVYRQAMVYVNEQLAGREAGGYAAFYVELTPWLRTGRNEIRVLVKNSGMTNSRWYSGSGIYRDVWLLRSGPVFLEPGGVRVTTERADADCAVLSVETTICNTSSEAKMLCLQTVICSGDDAEADTDKSRLFLRAGQSRTVRQRIAVQQPALWSEASPMLYSVKSALLDGEAILDTGADRFGIRTLSLDAVHGLRVNGESVKLRGACIHHDSGLLGAATWYDAHRRQVGLLKEAGFNAIRMSHHTAAPALLRACDELGMFVMDEFSDMWSRPKNDLDYALDFSDRWEEDVALMVRKDFNHPSVILYSVGNEIPEIGTPGGSELCAAISARFRTLDPTRYLTAGINGVFAAGDQMGRILGDLAEEAESAGADGSVNDFMTVMDTQMDRIVVHDAISERLELACAPLDVAGYNYMAARYAPDAMRYPNRVMVGSETYPPDIARNWALVQKLPAVIGDFTWTGWDYIGEAGVGIPAYAFGDGGFGAQYPCQLAYCGDLDITGFRRPLSYYREIVFGLRKTPYLAVQNPRHYGEPLIKTPWVMSDAVSVWNWPGCEGRRVVVEVYSAAETVELFLNGKSLGKQSAGQSHDYRALFETVYEPGELRAVDHNGAFMLSTPLASALKLEKTYWGETLCYVDVALTGPDDTLTAEVTGAELFGFGSGDPKPKHNYCDGRTETWNGRALLILKRAGDGPVHVRVCAASGLSAELSL